MAVAHPLAQRLHPEAPAEHLPLFMADLDRGLQVLARQENETARRVAVLLAAGHTDAEAGRRLGLTRPQLQEARRRLRSAAELALAD